MKDRHHRHGGHGDSGGVNLSLIITPMLDMSFQLLAFFIMTYHPSALEGHIPGSLVPNNPALKGQTNVASEAPEPVSPEDLLLELNEAMQIRLKSAGKNDNRPEGAPSQIYLIQGTENTLIADSDMSVDQGMNALLVKLKSIASQPNANAANIKVEGDAEMRQQYIMMAYDAAKIAGFKKVSFVPPPNLRQ